MATATELDLSSLHLQPTMPTSCQPDTDSSYDNMAEPRTAIQWADLIRTGLQAMRNSEKLSTGCLAAPRRGHADKNSATLATEIAALLYPAPTNSSIPQVIKYEKDIVALRKAIRTQQEAEETARRDARFRKPWKERVMAQGPWDEENDPLSFSGPPALPMPVEISNGESLAPFFKHLGEGGTHDTLDATRGHEAYYGVDVAEFEKGILYEDGRMDLCKMVLGPPGINALMKSLESNTFVRHFLLGNNMIGPVGARAIADFVQKYPNNIETWYLAGNCIDDHGLQRLVSAWTQSTSVTNIWLKRNPLGSKSWGALLELITKTPNLRTLDLDLTELGNAGVYELFRLLAVGPHKSLPLRNLYLNAVGAGEHACKALGWYLSSQHCKLESLYMSCNPIGDAGAPLLAQGLERNTSLLRLSITSCGLKSDGASHILKALHGHPRLMTLNMGQNFATGDVGARYNWLEDSVENDIRSLVRDCKSLKMLGFGTTAMTPKALAELGLAVAESTNLVAFEARSLHGKMNPKVKLLVNKRIERNVQHFYGKNIGEFEESEKRWLISPKDVRLIDSGYRNRDAGLARRGMLRLKKFWEDDMETVESVMHVDDPDLVA